MTVLFPELSSDARSNFFKGWHKKSSANITKNIDS